jgi:flagellin
MSAVLNTNYASLVAAKNLLGAQNKLAASVERLSSGLRINRARDDAAGLGVANSLTAQINGANQGIRNLNDAISMVQTAEGAIAAATDMGQRILTLATQGANGTLGSAEREAIKTEMLQLLRSIDSISGRTNYSGNLLLSEAINQDQQQLSAAKYSMQISNVSSDVVSLQTRAFLNVGFTVSGAGNSYSQVVTSTPENGTYYLLQNGSYVPVSLVGQVSTTPATYTLGSTTKNANDTIWAVSVSYGTPISSSALTAADAGETYWISGSGQTSKFWTFPGFYDDDNDDTTPEIADLRTADGYTSFTPVTFNYTQTTVSSAQSGQLYAAADKGIPEVFTVSGGQTTTTGYVIGSFETGIATYAQGSLPNNLFTLTAGSGQGQATALYNAVNSLSVSSASGWTNIQTLASQYVVKLGEQRSLLGAYQNEIEYTLSNITELSANLSSARSRIIDTDYASETAALTRGQILQQAATAMLAQANQMPNVILTLLK